VLRMAKKDLMEKIFDKGREYGLKDMEIYLGKGSSFRVRIHKGEIDNYSVSSSEGLSLRGEYNGQMGYAHTSKLDESSVEMLARNAKENAEVLTNEDKEVIFEGSPEYKLKDTYSEKLDRVTEKEKIEFAKEMEAKAYAFDKRIESVPYCYYGDSSGETLIKNTKGLELFSKNNMAYCIVNVVASDGNDKKSGTAYRASYSSSISIAPTNFYIENGDTDVAEMLNRMGTGIMITEIEGLHAGLNTVSGDFSLSARGFYIKNGKKERPVEQITVSGNYLTLLKDVAAVGNDFKFGMPDGGGYKGAPSLLIEKLSVAGE
jgi:predicted Zn-dependent protease